MSTSNEKLTEIENNKDSTSKNHINDISKKDVVPILTTTQEKNSREGKELKSPDVNSNRIHFKADQDDRRKSGGLNTNLINKDIEAIDFKQNTVCDDDDDDEKEESDFNVDAIDTMNAEKIVESGYLYIRSTKLKKWKKRWFVLRGTKLAYYKNEKEYKLISVIDLNTIHQVGKVNVSRPNVFGIVTLPRTYYMQGTSEEEKDKWIKKIRELVKINTGSKEHHHKEASGDLASNRRKSRSYESLKGSININNNNSNIYSSYGSIESNKSNQETNEIKNNDPTSNNSTIDNNNNNNNNNNINNNNDVININNSHNAINDNTNNNTINTINNDNNTSNNNHDTDKKDITNNDSTTKKKINKLDPILTSPSELDKNNSSKVKFIQSASVVESSSSTSPYSFHLTKNNSHYNEIKSARPYDEKYNRNEDDDYSSSEENLFVTNPVTGNNLLNDNVIIRQGYLLRQSSKYKTWKKRWFVLRNGKLTCYKNEKEYVVISIIPLSDTLDIIETEKPLGKNHKYCFKIITEGKAMILCSETQEECNNWIMDLQKYHKIIQNMKEKHGDIE